jgi:hypothetical protein
MTQRYYQSACRSATGALAAVCVAGITLAGCTGANVLNGSSAPSLPTGAPDSAATPGSSNQSQLGTSTSGAPSPQVSPESTTPTQPARPQRPNSVIALFFGNSLFQQCSITVAAGSSDTVFTIQRFVTQRLCFTGLGTSVPPDLVITTPGGVLEPMTLAGDSFGWAVVLYSVPGYGAEASLGNYSFQVTTPTPGSASTSPTAGLPSTSPTAGLPSTSPTAGLPSTSPTAGTVTTSGQFIVAPDTRPSASVGSESLGLQQVSLSAGSQLHIWFSGYPSFSTVYVSLYGPCAGQKCPWLVDLPGVRTDQHGEGTASWAIPPSAAVSQYPIWIDPPPAGIGNPCMALFVTG